jgi:hypothetical protein
MAHVDMFFRLVFVALAFCMAALATSSLAQRVADDVGQAERSKIQDAERPSVGQMHSTVVSMRADVAGIYVMLMFTNGLIAALLAAVIF